MRDRAALADSNLSHQLTRTGRAEAEIMQMRERAERAERLVVEQHALFRSSARTAAWSVGRSALNDLRTFLNGLEVLRAFLVTSIADAPRACRRSYGSRT